MASFAKNITRPVTLWRELFSLPSQRSPSHPSNCPSPPENLENCGSSPRPSQQMPSLSRCPAPLPAPHRRPSLSVLFCFPTTTTNSSSSRHSPPGWREEREKPNQFFVMVIAISPGRTHRHPTPFSTRRFWLCLFLPSFQKVKEDERRRNSCYSCHPFQFSFFSGTRRRKLFSRVEERTIQNRQ